MLSKIQPDMEAILEDSRGQKDEGLGMLTCPNSEHGEELIKLACFGS